MCPACALKLFGVFFLSRSGKAGSAGYHYCMLHEGLKSENSLLTYKSHKVLFVSLRQISFRDCCLCFCSARVSIVCTATCSWTTADDT